MDEFFEELFQSIVIRLIVRGLFSRFGLIVVVFLLLLFSFSIWESRPKIHIKNLDVIYNVKTAKKEKSMKIVFDLHTAHVKKRKCKSIAYFYYKSGKKVRRYSGIYRTKSNHLSSSKNFRPGYKYTEYNNMVIYIPQKYFPRQKKYQGRVTAYCSEDVWGNTITFSFNTHSR